MVKRGILSLARGVRGIWWFWQTCVGRLKLRLLGRARLGRGVRIHGRVNVRVGRGGSLVIGDQTRLNSGFSAQPLVPDMGISFCVGPRGRLEIGSRISMSATAILAYELVSIGDGTFVGGGVRILDGDGHSLDPSVRGKGADRDFKIAPVRIGKECFIGGLSLILKGVTIGDRAVIGAGSVVTRDVPAGEIWAGNPAKPIGKVPALGQTATPSAT